MASSSYCSIELNFFERGTPIDRWSGTITAEATPEELVEISRQCLLRYWKQDESGDLAPACSGSLIPDEVVVRAPDGRALYRRTIIDEKIDRWFAE
jgi:hypothetical protein